ncbi:MAG: tetratricopeptide repeat protein [Armatimonadetes bacterium]|nr:tetratricopeptide repeat protein [Armatimonadota bacterium]
MGREGAVVILAVVVVVCVGSAAGQVDLVGKAKQAKRQGDVEQAVTLLKQALAEQPKNAEAYYVLAWIYADRGKRKEALAAFQKVVQLAPGTPSAKEARAAIERLGGSVEKAGQTAASEASSPPKKASTASPPGAAPTGAPELQEPTASEARRLVPLNGTVVCVLVIALLVGLATAATVVEVKDDPGLGLVAPLLAVVVAAVVNIWADVLVWRALWTMTLGAVAATLWGQALLHWVLVPPPKSPTDVLKGMASSRGHSMAHLDGGSLLRLLSAHGLGGLADLLPNRTTYDVLAFGRRPLFEVSQATGNALFYLLSVFGWVAAVYSALALAGAVFGWS